MVGIAALAIAAGDQHSCVLLSTRVIRCVGGGSAGQLGGGTRVPRQLEPARPTGL
jgi:hypothetical protein